MDTRTQFNTDKFELEANLSLWSCYFQIRFWMNTEIYYWPNIQDDRIPQKINWIENIIIKTGGRYGIFDIFRVGKIKAENEALKQKLQDLHADEYWQVKEHLDRMNSEIAGNNITSFKTNMMTYHAFWTISEIGETSYISA